MDPVRENTNDSVTQPLPPQDEAVSALTPTGLSHGVDDNIKTEDMQAEVSAPPPLSPVPPLAVQAKTPEETQAMGATLTRHVEEGKNSIPENPEPLVCKPQQIESWRVFKIMSEFVEGFEVLRKYGLAATFFGTARSSFEQHFYDEATDLSGRLAKAGFAIFTGGNAGIMQAANKGAFEAGGSSIGLNIRLDENPQLNKYLTDSVTFDHFFVRKVMLAYASEVYIYFPGGFGTLDEFTEILTLVQTKKIRKVPIVLYGKEYWDPLLAFFESKLFKEHNAIDEADMKLYQVVDSVDEAFAYIQANVKC